MEEQNDPNFQGQQQAPSVPSAQPLPTTPPAGFTPQQPLIGTLPNTPGRKRRNYLTAIIVLLILVVGGLGAWKVLGNKSGNNTVTKTSTSASQNNQQPAVQVAYQNDYQVYKQTQQNAKVSTYTLVDKNGSKIQQAQAPTSLKLVSSVGNDMFLLVDTSNVEKPIFYSFSKAGLNQLSNLPASLTTPQVTRGVGPIGIKGYGADSVIYQYCSMDSTSSSCDIRIASLVTGSEKVIKVDELNTYGAHISALSADQKTAYFIGVSPQNLQDFLMQADKVSGGQVVSESDPAADKLYALNVQRSVLQVDLASQKVVAIKPVTTQYTYYGKFWISPNGQNLVYSNGGEAGQLHYVRISDNTQKIIKLPSATLSTEPFGATTTTYDPLYSPDGSSMAFVVYDTTGSSKYLETAGVINFANLSVKMFASQPAGSSGINVGAYFDNFRWLGLNQFDYTAGAGNYGYDTSSSSPKQLSTSYGNFVGIADGYH